MLALEWDEISRIQGLNRGRSLKTRGWIYFTEPASFNDSRETTHRRTCPGQNDGIDPQAKEQLFAERRQPRAKDKPVVRSGCSVSRLSQSEVPSGGEGSNTSISGPRLLTPFILFFSIS